MIILLEGADGTGKTTLANKLVECGYDYLHFGVPDDPAQPMEYWFNKLQHVSQPTVIDRLHLSEEAYGPVFRGGSALSELDWWVMEGWLWAHRCVLVVCSTSWEQMRVNQQKVRGVYHGEKQVEVVRNYDRLLSKTSLPKVIYDYTRLCLDCEPPVPVSRDRVNQKIQAAHGSQQPGPRWYGRPGLGTVQPKVWLVGERPGPKESPESLRNLPFRSTSGEYLRRALAVIGLAWDRAYLSNAYLGDTTLAHPLGDTWRELGEPKVVALGGAAHKALAWAAVPHEEVPHPQWWRRFQHHDLEGYAHAIREAARI